MSGLGAHLAMGTTTLARCWRLSRRDGVVLGFTDHDLDLHFDGVRHMAGSGLGALALSATTGMAVDNTEARGALSSDAITEEDLRAGRYDGAEVTAWTVNWADVAERRIDFRGSIGEVSWSGGAFRAEMRGLSEALNQPQGRVYQRGCTAVLGDNRCRVDLAGGGWQVETAIQEIDDGARLWLPAIHDRAAGWFEGGRLVMLDGAAAGLEGVVRADRIMPQGRLIELWSALRAPIGPGDRVRMIVGCDRRRETCRDRFANLVNFQGFPWLRDESWLLVSPAAGRGDG